MSTPDEHSWFSPSSASANMKCPARALADGRHRDDTNSPAAETGIACHAAIESMTQINEHKETFSEEWQEKALADAITQRRELTGSFRFEAQASKTEIRSDLEEYGRPDVFGTADYIIYDLPSQHLVVMDYKFGAGVPVTPENNAQLMIYALGLISGAVVNKVTLAIIQPRLHDKALTWETTAEHLKSWCAKKLLPAIERAEQANPMYLPGEEQCRWCSFAKNGCAAALQPLKDMLPETVKPIQDAMVSCDALSDLLKRVPDVEQAIKAVKATALTRMMEGQTVPDFKLILGRKNRRWAEPTKMDSYLQRKGIKQKDRYKMTLLAPAAVEKVLAAEGKLTPRVKMHLARSIDIPEGEPRIAPCSHKGLEYKPENLIDMLPNNDSIEDIL